MGKRGPKVKKVTITGAAKEVLSDKTKKVAQQHGVNVTPSTNAAYAKAKYSRRDKAQNLIFTAGRDLLQFNIVVRPYILRKYRIKKDVELDVLLYLFPIQYFTIKDFKALPIRSMGYYLNTLMDLDYIEVAVHHRNNASSNIYQLTDRAQKIVKEYYQYLGGEKTVNPNSYTNPFNDPEATKADNERNKLLTKMMRQTKTQPKKYRHHLWNDSLLDSLKQER